MIHDVFLPFFQLGQDKLTDLDLPTLKQVINSNGIDLYTLKKMDRAALKEMVTDLKSYTGQGTVRDAR